MNGKAFHRSVFSGWHKNCAHCQGIAVDEERECIYYSFTTSVVKTDFNGKLLASAHGFLGHLGCVAYHAPSSALYASLEYKNDAIGKGILRANGRESIEDGFYIVKIDVEKLTRPDMDAVGDGIFTAVYLSKVTQDYRATVEVGGGEVLHRYGCSGIDGITVVPKSVFGAPEESVIVAYGIYGDTAREDNDHQVLHRYAISTLDRYAIPLSQTDMHKNGPEMPDDMYFVYTGNTTYGVQNLEYDPYTGNVFAFVYRGKKASFKNPSAFVIDGHRLPKYGVLRGLGECGLTLELDEKTGMDGTELESASTGFYSFGDGYYAVSNAMQSEGCHSTEIKRYTYDGIRFNEG